MSERVQLKQQTQALSSKYREWVGQRGDYSDRVGQPQGTEQQHFFYIRTIARTIDDIGTCESTAHSGVLKRKYNDQLIMDPFGASLDNNIGGKLHLIIVSGESEGKRRRLQHLLNEDAYQGI